MDGGWVGGWVSERDNGTMGHSKRNYTAVVYARSKCCQSLDMCTAFAKPCEYARRRQMSR